MESEDEEGLNRQNAWEAWQAEWLGEGEGYREVYFSSGRRSGKTASKRKLQTLDLANCINKGCTGDYITRWYPPPTPNGPSPSIIHCGEVNLTVTAELSFEQYEAFVYGTAAEERPEDHPPAVGQEYRKLGGAHQKSTPLVYPVPTRFVYYGVLALGRFLCLLDTARGKRRQLRRRR
jgi:hypothetical protein